MFVISNSRATQEHTLYHNRSPQSGLSESACRFDDGQMSFDGGALLLRSVDRHVGLTRRLAACFADHRNPSHCENSLRGLLAQCLFGVALGYEDINDHDRLREDNLLALAVGIHWPVPTASDRLELGTPEQAGQDRYKRIVADPPVARRAAGGTVPRQLCRGARGDRADRGADAAALATRAGDWGFCRDELMAWCEGQAGADCVFVLARNPRLQPAFAQQGAGGGQGGMAAGPGARGLPRFGKGYATKGWLSHPFARPVSRWLTHCRTRATTFVSQRLDERCVRLTDSQQTSRT